VARNIVLGVPIGPTPWSWSSTSGNAALYRAVTFVHQYYLCIMKLLFYAYNIIYLVKYNRKLLIAFIGRLLCHNIYNIIIYCYSLVSNNMYVPIYCNYIQRVTSIIAAISYLFNPTYWFTLFWKLFMWTTRTISERK